MPATATTSRTGLINVMEPVRTCPFPGHQGERALAFTHENFYVRPNGTADYWCRECVRADNRARRAARRANGAITRKWGVEIECIVDRYDLERELRARGLRVFNAGYTHRVMAEWKIVTDASVGNGYELVSPPLKGRDGMTQLRKACEALAAAGARVNRSCGLHVHHDVSDLTADQFGRLLRAWSNNQANTDGLVAPSRRRTQWAQPLRLDEVVAVENAHDIPAIRGRAAYVDRYRSLNINCFPRYGTVEVRQHQGSLNFDKIAAWIAFGQAFMTWAKSDAAVDSELTTDALITRLAAHGLPTDRAEFLRTRAAHFSGAAVAA